MPDTLVYTAWDGSTLDLSDEVNIKLRHHDGFGTPDFEHQTLASPDIPGDYWFGVRYPARDVTVDLVLNAPSLADLQNLRELIIRRLNPTMGGGTLTLTQSNGAVRALDCVLAERLSMPTAAHIARQHMMLTVRFRSTGSPFLYDPDQKTLVLSAGSPISGFMAGGMSFPFELAQSGVFTQLIHTSDGHVPTPVRVVMTGPGDDPIFRSNTLGRSVSFSGLSVSPSGNLIVNMDPRTREITLYGSDAWDQLSASEFWWLQPGANDLVFEVANSTPGTVVTMYWYDRYLGV